MENHLSKHDILQLKAVILYILEQCQEGLDKIHIAKILYYAQQEHLVRYALPLVEDTFAAKRYGPVPLFTDSALNYVCNENTNDDKDAVTIADSISVTYNNHEDGNAIAIYHIKDGVTADISQLSKSRVEILDSQIAKFKSMPSLELSKMSHKDKAWKQADRQFKITGEITVMPLYSIAKAGNALPGILQSIREYQQIKSYCRC